MTTTKTTIVALLLAIGSGFVLLGCDCPAGKELRWVPCTGKECPEGDTAGEWRCVAKVKGSPS